MEWRPYSRLKEPHPPYYGGSPSFTFEFRYGGEFSQSGYTGGLLEKIDYVPHPTITLSRLNDFCDERGILKPPRAFHVRSSLTFTRLTCDSDLKIEVGKQLEEGTNEKELVLFVTQVDGGRGFVQPDDDFAPSRVGDRSSVEPHTDDVVEEHVQDDETESSMWDTEGEPRSISDGDSERSIDADEVPVECNAPRNNQLEVGSVFPDRATFKDVIRTVSIADRRGVKFVKNDKRRCWAVCDSESCNWKCNLNKPEGDDGDYRVTSVTLVHTCTPKYKLKMLNAKWISNKFVDKYRLDRNRSSNVFRQEIQQELGVEVTINQAYCARKLCLRQIELTMPPLLPPVYGRRTGHPKKHRFKSSREIPPRKRNRRKCSKCRQPGHTKNKCPMVTNPRKFPGAEIVADPSASDASRDPRAIIRARATTSTSHLTVPLDADCENESSGTDYLLSGFDGEDDLTSSQSEEL